MNQYYFSFQKADKQYLNMDDSTTNKTNCKNVNELLVKAKREGWV